MFSLFTVLYSVKTTCRAGTSVTAAEEMDDEGTVFEFLYLPSYSIKNRITIEAQYFSGTPDVLSVYCTSLNYMSDNIIASKSIEDKII